MKKIVLTIFIFTSLLFLTGCGADVTSVTKFNQDSSGYRTITAEISESDAKNLANGFSDIDRILEDAAPDGVKLNHEMQPDGSAKYYFTFQFTDIDDYNRKVEQITGEEHNATWYSGSDVFKSNIEFSEEECTYDLIAWAIDAFKDSPYAAFSSNFSTYNVNDSKVYYNDEIVFSGDKNPSFTIETSPELERVNIYTDYDYEGNKKKTIELLFEKGSLTELNVEDAKKALNAYSLQNNIDTANDKIVYTLEGEQINDFLLSADLSNEKENATTKADYNPFRKQYEFAESYCMEQFMSQFSHDEDLYVYEYVKLPEVLNSTKVTQNEPQTDVEATEDYPYVTAHRYDEKYSMTAKAESVVDVKNITVEYNMTDDLKCQRVIQMEYSKNECDITQQEMLGYFPNVKDSIDVSDQGDVMKIRFTKNMKKGDGLSDGFGFEKKNRFTLKYIRYALKDQLDFTKYVPELTGYSWNLKDVPYKYIVTTKEESGVLSIQAGGTEYNESNGLLKCLDDQKNYVVSGQAVADKPLTVNIDIKQIYHLYYLWLLIFLFIIVVAVLAVVIYYITKKSDKNDHSVSEVEIIE